MSLKVIEIGISYATSGSELTELDNLLSQGYRVVDCSTYTYDSEVTQRWTLHLPSPSVENTPSFLTRVQAILHNANIGYTDVEQRPDNTARMTIARDDVPKLDRLPLQLDLIWRTETSARIEVLSIGDEFIVPAPFVCECCGVECNGSVRNGHLYCQECLTELDESYE